MTKPPPLENRRYYSDMMLIRMFRGILQKPNDDRSVVDELIQERREEI